MAQYRFAYCSNQLIDAHAMSRSNVDRSAIYTCISCNNQLIPRIGELKENHFAHKSLTDCSGETYLHKLAKKLFKLRLLYYFHYNQEFILNFQQEKICTKLSERYHKKCHLGKNWVSYDLTKYFNRVLEEEPIDGFIPDLTLCNTKSKGKIFIEIAVTHSCSEEKIASGHRIIEIKIEQESDILSLIRNTTISEDDHNIRLYNFKGNEGVHCQGHCAKLHPVFINYKDGRNHLRRMNLNHYKNFRQKFKDEIFYARILEDSTLYMKLFITEMLNLTEKKAIRNCMFCKYHAYKAHPHEVFDHDLPYFEDVKYPCKMQGGLLVNSNEALSCEYYNSNTPFEYEHYLSGKEDH